VVVKLSQTLLENWQQRETDHFNCCFISSFLHCVELASIMNHDAVPYVRHVDLHKLNPTASPLVLFGKASAIMYEDGLQAASEYRGELFRQ
jgi:hypothetical protein